MSALQNWLTKTEHKEPWIAGHYDVPLYPSELTLTATYVVSSVERIGAPVVCHVCNPKTKGRNVVDAARTSSSDGLIALIYSLIRQLVSQVSSNLQDGQLLEVLLDNLDGTA